MSDPYVAKPPRQSERCTPLRLMTHEPPVQHAPTALAWAIYRAQGPSSVLKGQLSRSATGTLLWPGSYRDPCVGSPVRFVMRLKLRTIRPFPAGKGPRSGRAGPRGRAFSRVDWTPVPAMAWVGANVSSGIRGSCFGARRRCKDACLGCGGLHGLGQGRGPGGQDLDGLTPGRVRDLTGRFGMPNCLAV